MRPSLQKIFLPIVVFCSFCIYGQGGDVSKTKDSLADYDYEALKERFSLFFDSIPSTSLHIARAYVTKAKLENNLKELQEGYILITYLSDYTTAIKYCDSTLTIARQTDDKEVLAKTNFIKGGYHFTNRNFKEALDCYLIADKLAYAVEGEQFRYFIKYSIGTLKVRLSKHNEAKEIFKECTEYLENKKATKPYNYFYLSSIHALSNAYRRLDLIDSSSFINTKGYKVALIYKDSNSLSHFIVNEGINQLENKNYQVALDSMEKGVKYFERMESGPNLIVSYFYIGRAYDESGDMVKGIQYYKKVDSLFKITNDLKPETREAYDRMIAYYRKENNKEKLLETIESLLKVDSILNSNYRYLNDNIIKKYDTPQLLTEKEELIASLNKGKKSMSRWLDGAVVLLILSGIAIFYYFKKQNEYKKRFKELLQDKKVTAKPVTANSKASNTLTADRKNLESIGISEELVHEIQSKLNSFVENNGFLDNSITLNSLSKELNTNSKYLSKLINHYEEKNFSKYINDLRIDYTVEKLQTDRMFRNYAIKAIADEVGFNNTESFSKAFYKKTGIYPSFFIKQLDKE